MDSDNRIKSAAPECSMGGFPVWVVSFVWVVSARVPGGTRQVSAHGGTHAGSSEEGDDGARNKGSDGGSDGGSGREVRQEQGPERGRSRGRSRSKQAQPALRGMPNLGDGEWGVREDGDGGQEVERVCLCQQRLATSRGTLLRGNRARPLQVIKLTSPKKDDQEAERSHTGHKGGSVEHPPSGGNQRPVERIERQEGREQQKRHRDEF
mmetsp:Transcript_28923/g.66906  ORF Transcript_28923/g.66906 Transcript_28923/m.66906 type:complete len:208 (+) Transcript_28923:83-706(+)